ncbi:MAG: M48 family metalloprotease [Spirochaetaceae bacterium]
MKIKIIITIFILVILTSCSSLLRAGNLGGFDVVSFVSDLDADDIDAITETVDAGKNALEDITPEQEYYIGRAVGATILASYDVYEDSVATEYINKIGTILSYNSSRPETFAGYHFLILDSDEINAFASPGGHIFISKGMIRLAENEDEIAAILAHEIAHVALKHGLDAIKKSRVTSFLTVLGTNSLKVFGSEEVSQLTEVFEGSIGDITSTLVNSGYSRSFEKKADEETISILEDTGYDKFALNRILYKMSEVLNPKGLDFAKTHPDPLDRIDDIEKSTGVSGRGYKKRASKRYINNLDI